MQQVDIAFNIGFGCGGSLALRKAGLQFASYPLDWIGSPGIVQSARLIASDFQGWFEKEDWRLLAVRGGSFQSNVYQNRKTHFVSAHDFSRFVRFAESFPRVVAKYERRVSRFLSALEGARSALAVYIEAPFRPRTRDEDLVEAKRLLESRFPKVRFELVYFHLPEEGAAGERIPAEGITVVACEYAQFDHGEVSHAIDWDVQYAYLKSRFKVEDRRTPAEREAYVNSKKTARRKRFAGRLNEIKYRIYRRMEKDLQEKGLLPRDFPLRY